MCPHQFTLVDLRCCLRRRTRHDRMYMHCSCALSRSLLNYEITLVIERKRNSSPVFPPPTYSIVPYSTVWYNTAWYSMLYYTTFSYNMKNSALCYTMLCYDVLYYAMLCCSTHAVGLLLLQCRTSANSAKFNKQSANNPQNIRKTSATFSEIP